MSEDMRFFALLSWQRKEKVNSSSGDDGEEDPPVPIPNTEVKLFSADGTWWETARESRTLPERRKMKPSW